MKNILKVLLSIALFIVVIFAGGMFYMTRGLDSGSKLTIDAANLSTIRDGTYNGRYDAGRWANEVKVIVKDHKITMIDVVKDVTFPKPEWTKQLFDKVIEKQGTNVDIVSGATVTSKAYLKSIENALNK